ncbi:MAG: hypothetical protein H0T89_26575 [Deltaproteobacteria bacterium]|nr:hypothetical protein [Deltaproteobacteria bacterium]MDQ3301603.1 hypothetical protein [Myxococcota bacterium]
MTSAKLTRCLAETFKIHPLTIEDIWGAQTAPKIDDFPGYLYLFAVGAAGTIAGSVGDPRRATGWIGSEVVLDAAIRARGSALRKESDHQASSSSKCRGASIRSWRTRTTSIHPSRTTR